MATQRPSGDCLRTEGATRAPSASRTARARRQVSTQRRGESRIARSKEMVRPASMEPARTRRRVPALAFVQMRARECRSGARLLRTMLARPAEKRFDDCFARMEAGVWARTSDAVSGRSCGTSARRRQPSRPGFPPPFRLPAFAASSHEGRKRLSPDVQKFLGGAMPPRPSAGRGGHHGRRQRVRARLWPWYLNR